MSDDLPVPGPSMADAITADLSAMDQAPAPEAPKVEAAEVAKAEPETPSVPAAETKAEVTPEPIALTDKSIVIDPATGEQRTWGEVKAERLRWKDYTQKTMTLAEQRKAVEAEREQFLAQQQVAQTQQQLSGLPDLPEDDPYAQRIRAIEAQQQAFFAAQEQQRVALESERLDAASAKLDADVSRVSSEYKLNEREMDIVGRELLSRMHSGDQVSLDDIAKQFSAYRDSLKESAVKEWREKHRVSAPAAAVAVPAAGTPEEMPVPGTRNFAERMLAELGISR